MALLFRQLSYSTFEIQDQHLDIETREDCGFEAATELNAFHLRKIISGKFLRSSVVLGVSFFLLITVLEHASTKWYS